jgi:hypothetical protein
MILFALLALELGRLALELVLAIVVWRSLRRLRRVLPGGKGADS